jgi:hypothetical protein
VSPLLAVFLESLDPVCLTIGTRSWRLWNHPGRTDRRNHTGLAGFKATGIFLFPSPDVTIMSHKTKLSGPRKLKKLHLYFCFFLSPSISRIRIPNMNVLWLNKDALMTPTSKDTCDIKGLGKGQCFVHGRNVSQIGVTE